MHRKMKRLKIEWIEAGLLVTSFACVFLSLFLTSASLSRSVKWNEYDSFTDYGLPSVFHFKLYAWQNLWTFYDGWMGPHDKTHSQAYREIIIDPWRAPIRKSVIASVVLGLVSLTMLTVFIGFGVVQVLKNKGIIKNKWIRDKVQYISAIFLVASSVISCITGITLGTALQSYKEHYPLLLAPEFYDPTSFYPDEDNLTTGYQSAAAACGFYFISMTLNSVYLGIKIKQKMSSRKIQPNDTHQEQDSNQMVGDTNVP